MLGYLVVGLAIVFGVTADDCTPKSCPDHGAKLLSIPSDCSRYISCLNGQSVVRKCSGGLRFDKELHKCVQSNQAECDSCDGSSEEIGEVLRHFAIRKHFSKIEPVSDDLPKTNNISQRCLENSITKVECPDDIADDRLLPHPDDCRLFYVCVTIGRPPVCRDCPPGLHFNPIKKVCDHPASAGCRSFIMVKPVPFKTPDLSKTLIKRIGNKLNHIKGLARCEQDNTGLADLRPDPKNCSKYYVCDWGFLIPMTCPEGLHFSTMFKLCDLPQNARCQLENDTRANDVAQSPVLKELAQPREGLIQCEKNNGAYADLRPDPKNCSKYYVCDWGFLIPMSCPDGLHFSTAFKVCDLPQNARCQLENATHVNDDAQSPALVEPGQPREDLLQCEEHNGVYADLRPDSKNCSKYYVCDWGQLIPMVCPQGLHFNAVLKVCDSPYTANCPLFRPSANVGRSSENQSDSSDGSKEHLHISKEKDSKEKYSNERDSKEDDSREDS